MRVVEYLRQAEIQLAEAGIGTARLDALVLLEDISGKERSWLLAHPEFELAQAKLTKLRKLLSRRAGHEPLAYIRGQTEFYGRDFVITPNVLEPRPESETMIELLKSLPLFSRPEAVSGSLSAKDGLVVRIADVGTGSGALGITAALEVPNVSLELLDIDPDALKVAKTNVDKFTLNISITKSDLLTQSARDYAVLLCNLPYIPDDYTINQAAMREPRIAIFGGPDGLDLYRRLFRQVPELLKQPLYILTESLPTQHVALQAIAKKQGYRLAKTDDFIQLFAKPYESC